MPIKCHWPKQFLIPTVGRGNTDHFSTGCTNSCREPGSGEIDHSASHCHSQEPQPAEKKAAPVCDACLQWVLIAALNCLITEIEGHLSLWSLIKEEIFNFNSCVLEGGVLSNQFCAPNSNCATPLKLIEINNAENRQIMPGESSVHGNILVRRNNVQVLT